MGFVTRKIHKKTSVWEFLACENYKVEYFYQPGLFFNSKESPIQRSHESSLRSVLFNEPNGRFILLLRSWLNDRGAHPNRCMVERLGKRLQSRLVE
jgi:hypothetical protein